jgi:putative phage-type endonuclease
MDVLKYLTNCKVFSTVTQEADEEGWLKARTKGIGGSDVGAICGVSPFASARQIYFNKTGQFQDSVQPNEAAVERMHFGHLLEPIVADEYARRTGNKIITVNATLVHKDYPWALANVDRLIVDDEGKPCGVLECKTTSEYMKDEWESGDILLSYVYQLNWYLWILGLERGAIACLVGGNKFYYYDVFRNDELLNKTIIPTVKDFWYNNVQALKEPALQAIDSDFVNEKYKDVEKNSEVFLQDDETNELARTVFKCKTKINELKKIMTTAQNRLKDKLQNHEIGYTRDFTIKWSLRSQTRVDTEKLKKDFPDVYKQVQKKIDFRTMIVKGVEQ